MTTRALEIETISRDMSALGLPLKMALLLGTDHRLEIGRSG
jgi:hypothetical protein